ncbi:hypothetical protein [Phenylobacterium sp.]|uniref:hypothetical protein n=1 Tax=Phenylobacterium sp. TaxID=1871053 RepID=UPI002FC89439
MLVNTKLLWLAAALALAACDQRPAETRPPAHVAAPTIDVARLAADRAALDDAHARCKARAADATPELCAAAAEATRRRFSGSASVNVPAPAAPNLGDANR